MSWLKDNAVAALTLLLVMLGGVYGFVTSDVGHEQQQEDHMRNTDDLMQRLEHRVEKLEDRR